MNYRKLFSHFAWISLVSILAAPSLSAQVNAPAPPNLNAKGYLLVDANSGRILASKNADDSLEPASITKLMTGYAVFRSLQSEQINLDDKVLISEKAWRTPGSRMFIEVGTQVAVSDLLPGMIVQSGNDASVALAEHVAGTEEAFSQVMNQLGKELGMTATHFVNSTGLPDETHLTTATDIGLLAAAIIQEFPEYYRWYSQREFTYNGITQGNRNALLWRDDSVDGMKTGYTESAGYCLVASAERDGMRLISVVLGTKSPTARENESQALLNYGFRFYETRKLWDAGQVVSTARVWKGESESADLVVGEAVYVTVPRGSMDSIVASAELPENLIAPLDPSIRLGSATATLQGEIIATAPLFPATAVAEAGILGAAWDELLLWFE